ncbi:bifunctional methylenetetrahydrofolate dehydrogenase/methenyltetrahydrofolate cyclohydrolase FolD [Candidatus Saganbacteria bacterium]|nr:bifunctional methylenetetrahydrofolate dehydrogenase/methenyltetrahydrofolate cyclohydrolase FolD [Candidatus Saganbacteria bacterium]
MIKVIDGKGIAARIRGEVAQAVKEFKGERAVSPKLCVVLVGGDPASQVYVRNKEKACQEVGMIGEVYRLPATASQLQLNQLIRQLNADRSVHGILLQLPAPKGLDPISALDEISPDKDVDGLHPLNMGKLLRGEELLLAPCTPSGIMELIITTGISYEGAEAVVVGRSNIVGKPVALLLLQRHATVTICHSRTKDLADVCRRADILVAAVGSPGIIRGEMVKPGAVVIDVGTNRIGEKLVGDVEFESVKEVAGFITPVPGGVGPMTIAMLLKNTLQAAKNLTTKQS